MSTRRSNGEGTWGTQISKGREYIVYRIYINGKRKAFTGRTKEEVLEKYNKFISTTRDEIKPINNNKQARTRTMKEEQDHFCVYRLLDEDDNVLYIGKSIQMKLRIANHLRGRSNIPEECCKKINKVEFLEFKTEVDMDIFELYAISYFQPPYNIEGVSNVGIIKIEMPKIWNELLLDSFHKVIKVETIGGAEKIYQKDLKNIDMEGLKFNRDIFINEDLTYFLEKHYNKDLTLSDINDLIKICNMDTFDIEAVNNYIVYNDSRAEIIMKEGTAYLKKNPKSKQGYGSVQSKKMSGKNYLYFRVRKNGIEKGFYGNNRLEIASKVIKYYASKQVALDLFKDNDGGTKEVNELLNKLKPNKQQTEGINKALYEHYKNEEIEKETKIEPVRLLTKDEVMECLHIKNYRTFAKLIKEDNLPHTKIGKSVYVPVDGFNEWVRKNTING